MADIQFQQEFLCQVREESILLIESHWEEVAINKDHIYLSPKYRKGMTGIRLMKFAEKYLRKDGASVMIINTKVKNPFDPILERLGFNLTERVYTKYLGGNC